MQTRFEHFAATSMIGSGDAPPRTNGTLQFSSAWERRAFGLALALSKDGHYEWEQFRQRLIDQIALWEKAHDLGDRSWDYYQQWLGALERVVLDTGLLDSAQLAERAQAIDACCKDEA